MSEYGKVIDDVFGAFRILRPVFLSELGGRSGINGFRAMFEFSTFEFILLRLLQMIWWV